MYRMFTLFLLVACLSGCFGSGGGGGGGGNNGVPDTNADLFDLSLSAGPLDQVFQANQTIYTATVGFLAAATTVTPTTADADATVTVNATAVVSGQASGFLSLAQGASQISIVVTAEDGVTTKTYTVTVTRQLAASFGQKAFLKASNANSNDYFGAAVALSGDTLVVGATGEGSSANGGAGDNSAPDAGAVYVFVRNNNGGWIQQPYLKASNADSKDLFGSSVALSGDTLAVGAIGEGSRANGGEADNSAPNTGAVYVFVRNNIGVWVQQAYLKASNADAKDLFGSSVALSGDTLVVGAIGEGSSRLGGADDNSAPDAGAAYVFVRNNNGVWVQQPYLKASNADAGDLFGTSVAISEGTLAVGAVGEGSSAAGGAADNSALSAGAVYVFTRNNNGVWLQQPYIKASKADAGDQFGLVALSADTLAVGAVGEGSSALGGADDNSAPNAGAVYVFTRNNNGIWVQQPYLKASNADAGDQFGLVTLSGDTLVVGAVTENSSAVGGEADDSAPNAGAAYVFIRSNGVWMQQPYLKASNAEANDQFGWVGFSGDTLITGAFGEGSSTLGGEADNSTPDAGAGYVFQ